jgi:GMP synthase (glutamine-hydrolysing)
MGGPMSVNDEQTHPFLAEEKPFIESVIEAGSLVLGVCLGAQLVADVLGAPVTRGDQPEIGWYPCTRKPGAEGSVVFGALPETIKPLHWHGDAFAIPESAVDGYASEACENQAFAIGDSVLALQFHPEVTGQALERWYIGHIVEIMTAGLSVPELRSDAARFSSALVVQGKKFLGDWLDSIAGRT